MEPAVMELISVFLENFAAPRYRANAEEHHLVAARTRFPLDTTSNPHRRRPCFVAVRAMRSPHEIQLVSSHAVSLAPG